MFDVGFSELFLLALIGLIILGPERLPAVARTLGGFIRKARVSWISLRNTIESELAEAEIAAPIKEAGEELKRFAEDMSTGLPDLSNTPGFLPESRESNTALTSMKPESSHSEDGAGESPSGDADNGTDSDARRS